MERILLHRNRDLLENITSLLGLLSQAEVPEELESYRDAVTEVCDQYRQRIGLNLVYLQLGQPELFEDVLSNTQQATQILRHLSSLYATPVLRAADFDRLSLRMIGWLHKVHPETRDYPPAFGTSSWAIFPFRGIPVYFLPSIEQQGLLYQPLLFHEFGHLLYRVHEDTMNALVKNLQRAVADFPVAASQRNDPYSEEQASRHQVVVDRWFSWTQEIFCDAVGLTIGGPCFLRAFSAFLSTIDRGDFYSPREDLERSRHPVTWLRVQLLTRRASSIGLNEVAQQVDEEWNTVAQTMGVTEDYHGFYGQSLETVIIRTIDDMLSVAKPRESTMLERSAENWSPESDSPVALLNWAWNMHLAAPADYRDWETEQIQRLLT